jgi:hypothetical protein
MEIIGKQLMLVVISQILDIKQCISTGRKPRQHVPLLYGIWLLSHGQTMKIQISQHIWSGSTLFTFDSLAYIWPSSNQCRSWSDGMDVMTYMDLHYSHMWKKYMWSKGQISQCKANKPTKITQNKQTEPRFRPDSITTVPCILSTSPAVT